METTFKYNIKEINGVLYIEIEIFSDKKDKKLLETPTIEIQIVENSLINIFKYR